MTNKTQMNLKFVENVINIIKNDPTCIISANAFQAANFNSIVTNHFTIDQREHIFSHQITDDVEAVDQKSAGVCWMCGGMSVCRRAIINNLKLGKSFHLSLNHLMFWDKIERCNYFMAHIIQNKNQKFDSIKITKLINSPISDGGYWHTFSDLVTKYGMIPDTIFKRRISNINTTNLNKLLKYKLREFASLILSPNKDIKDLCTSDIDVELLRQDFMAKIIRILVSMVGYPYYPNTTFEWTYVDKYTNKKIIKDLTPLKFYKEYCYIDFDDYVPIINDPRPRHPYNETYEMVSTTYLVKDRSTTQSHILLNLEFDENVKLIMKQIDAKIPVWFSCDVGKYTNHSHNIMDIDLYNYGLPFDTSFSSMSKADRIDFRDSYPSHVMCIIGYDLEGTESEIKNKKKPNKSTNSDSDGDLSKSNKRKRQTDTKPIETNIKKQKVSETKNILVSEKKNESYYNENVKKVIKFKVENSWGDIGVTDGFYMMTKDWFEQYGYEIIINKNHLSKKQQEYLTLKPNKMSNRDPLSLTS
jgi:bleomycin hydrolase